MDTLILIWQITLSFGVVVAALMVTHILQNQQSRTRTLSWILGIILVPYIGVPLYYLIGGRKSGFYLRNRGHMHFLESKTVSVDLEDSVDKVLRSYGVPGAVSGNKIDLCVTGQQAYYSLIYLIEGAKKSIYISTYIFEDDNVGKEILQRLVKKAESGVEVLVLVDDAGNHYVPNSFFKPLRDAGGKFGLYNRVASKFLVGRANLRNHRKIVVVDAQQVFAGGMNLAEDYMSPEPIEGQWKDLSFVLEGPAVWFFLAIFHSNWEFATGEHLPTEDLHCPEALESSGHTEVAQVVASGPDVEEDPLYAAILSSIYEAKERCWIVTPYFIPDDALAQALELAAHRGVDVRILVPYKSNHPLTDLARRSYLRQIAGANGKILLYLGGMVHAKAGLIDNRLAWCGSANMDMRSLFLNYESVMFVYSEKTIQAIEEWMLGLMSNVRHGVRVSSKMQLIFEGLIRLFAPLL
ncbi:MAG: phospholipase D-like domain-containing protein [Desulfovibrio sp.]